MPSLADTQRRVRQAVVAGDLTGVRGLLVGGSGDGTARLAIHRRHYEASLVSALLGKFPATVWLAGGPFVTDAARAFVHEQPPTAPCIAEYGDTFPAFLGARAGAAALPYLVSFAELEWHLGHVAIAVDEPPLTGEEIAAMGDSLSQTPVVLQPGVRYVHAGWPVDRLIALYLNDAAPDRLSLEPEEAWIEIRGARGEFQFTRLEQGAFAFRELVRRGLPLGEAADRALACDAAFDPGHALAALVAEGLIVGVHLAPTGGER